MAINFEVDDRILGKIYPMFLQDNKVFMYQYDAYRSRIAEYQFLIKYIIPTVLLVSIFLYSYINDLFSLMQLNIYFPDTNILIGIVIMWLLTSALIVFLKRRLQEFNIKSNEYNKLWEKYIVDHYQKMTVPSGKISVPEEK